MTEDRHIWEVWARVLHQWGLREGMAAFLESAGSLSILGAQLIYLGQPLFRHSIESGNLQALVRILENSEDRKEFLTLLKEVSEREPG